MHSCIHTSIYIYIYACMNTRMYLDAHTHTTPLSTYISVCTYVYMYVNVCTYIHMYRYTYLCVHAHVYDYKYVCTYADVHAHCIPGWKRNRKHTHRRTRFKS